MTLFDTFRTHRRSASNERKQYGGDSLIPTLGEDTNVVNSIIILTN